GPNCVATAEEFRLDRYAHCQLAGVPDAPPACGRVSHRRDPLHAVRRHRLNGILRFVRTRPRQVPDLRGDWQNAVRRVLPELSGKGEVLSMGSTREMDWSVLYRRYRE